MKRSDSNAPAALQDLRDRSLQVVIADHLEDPAEPVERAAWASRKACWVSRGKAIAKAPPE